MSTRRGVHSTQDIKRPRASDVAEGMTQREETSMSKNTGITPRPGGGFQAQVWDAKAAKRISRTFPTRSAAKQWRHDAMSDLRAGDLSADRGPDVR